MRQGIKIRSEVLNEIVCSSVRTNSDKSQEGQYWSNDTRTKVGKLMCWSVCQLVEHDWKRIVAAFCALRHAEQVLLEGELIRQTVVQANVFKESQTEVSRVTQCSRKCVQIICVPSECGGEAKSSAV